MSTNKNFSPRLAAVNDNLITLSLMPLHEEGIAILTRSHFKGERQWSFNPDELILIPGSGVTSTFVNRMSRSDLNVPAEVAEFLLKYPGKVPPQ